MMQYCALILTQCRHGHIQPWFNPVEMNEVRNVLNSVLNMTEKPQMRIKLKPPWEQSFKCRYRIGTPPVVQSVFLPLSVHGNS